jgi:hypothetical protein
MPPADPRDLTTSPATTPSLRPGIPHRWTSEEAKAARAKRVNYPKYGGAPSTPPPDAVPKAVSSWE